MKKFLIFACLTMTCSLNFAQLKIGPDGKVAIGTDATPLSTMSVNSAGEVTKEVSIESTKSITFSAVHKATGSYSGWAKAIDAGVATSPYLMNAGTIGYAYASSAINSGRGFGLIGIGGNYTSGFNYGVLGMLYGTNNGAGVYGTSVHNDYGIQISGRYAGYFRGNVFVTGSVNGMLLTPATTMAIPSVLSAQPDEEESTTIKLASLNTVQYSMQSPLRAAAASLSADTVATPTELSAAEAQIYSRSHYGLVAQELREVYPTLVYENEQGDLSINYIEMIPLLVQSIRELSTEVEQLKSENALTRGTVKDSGKDENASNPRNLLISKLFQNVPNPFSQSTEIAYQLSNDIRTASISIYNLNGGLLKRYPLSPAAATGKIQVNATEFEPGMYVYALVIDGAVIDSKRMVLE